MQGMVLILSLWKDHLLVTSLILMKTVMWDVQECLFFKLMKIFGNQIQEVVGSTLSGGSRILFLVGQALCSVKMFLVLIIHSGCGQLKLIN